MEFHYYAALAATLSCMPVAAQAELPVAVEELIDAAVATGDAKKVDTVVALARSAYPGDGPAIDALAARAKQQLASKAAEKAAGQEAEIRSAGLLDNWSGRGELGAFQASGNSDDLGVTAGLKIKREGIDWRHKLSALVDYRESDSVATREQFLFAYEPNYKITERLYAYGLGQYERDRFQGISTRLVASGGLGYDVIDTDSVFLSLKGGPAFRFTDFTDGTRTERVAGLAALDFDWNISDRLTLTEDAEALVEDGATSLRAVTGLEADLGGSLIARVSYVVEHETNPPAGAEKTDTLTRVTVVYDF
ncbi:MAG: DUF481 domain-containing protein [Sphingomonas sp.]|nr:DUF481 domain-containing protein [Sphingomonas sp.]RZV52718.1 MAG: DUF481 domain-containing protein [Sphingomonadaceae bacterium]